MQCQCGAQVTGGSFCTNCGRQVQVRTEPPISPVPPAFQPAPQTGSSNIFSILGMSFGGVALLIFPILFGPIAIGFGITALVKKEKLGGLALGISLGGFFLGMLFGVFFWSSFYF
mgnify:CR=1 FL=1|jgi:hypothetical protein